MADYDAAQGLPDPFAGLDIPELVRLLKQHLAACLLERAALFQEINRVSLERDQWRAKAEAGRAA